MFASLPARAGSASECELAHTAWRMADHRSEDQGEEQGMEQPLRVQGTEGAQPHLGEHDPRLQVAQPVESVLQQLVGDDSRSA